MIVLVLVVVVGQIGRKDLSFVSRCQRVLHLFGVAQVRRRDSFFLELGTKDVSPRDELWCERLCRG